MQTNAALLTVAACCCTLTFTHASVWPCFRSVSSLRLRSLLHARQVKDPVTILLNIRFSSVFCHLGSRRLLLVTPHQLSDESLLTNFSEQTADTWQSNVGLSDWPRAADVTNSTEAFDHDVSSLVGQLPVGEEFVVTMATCYVGNCRGVVMGDAETRETTQEMPAYVERWMWVLGVVAGILVFGLLILAWRYRHFCQLATCSRLLKRKGSRLYNENLPSLPDTTENGRETGNFDDPYDDVLDRNSYLEAGNQGNSEQQNSSEAAGGQQTIQLEMETTENTREPDSQQTIQLEMETTENTREPDSRNAWDNNVNSAFHDDTLTQMETRNSETNA